MPADLEALRGFFRAAPFMADMGIEPVACEKGKVTTRMTIQPRHYQHTGHVHAGVTTALADHTMGAAAQTLAPAGHWVMTAEVKSSLLRAARGQQLECIATVIKPGRNVMFTEAEVWCIEGSQRNLVAKVTATMAVTTARGG
jgi:uncharacterized protein (TIGR00369 family)